ncbi:hypothetical protein LQZ19_15090 [Treponema primitia]|uniref:hypothetical protein n=1 Tax=Treponema primitia TaxID=88058 RepID=UPI00397F07BC
MEAVKAYYDGRVFTPEGPVNLAKNTTVIISFSEGERATDLRSGESPYRITAAEKRVRDAAESDYLNTYAERLNAEMVDVLGYQKDLF